MPIIFNANNLTQGTTYNSLDTNGIGYLRATLPVLSGLNVSCYIQLSAGGQSTLMGTFSNTKTTLPLPKQFEGSKVRFHFVSNLDIPSLKIEFQEQYDYSFNRDKPGTGNNYDDEFNQLQQSVNNYGQSLSNLATHNDISNLASSLGDIPRSTYGDEFNDVKSSLGNLGTGQAILIGGARTAIQNDIANLQAIANAGRAESANSPRNTYNDALATLQAMADSINSQVGQIPRTNYSGNFSAIGTQLTAMQATESNILSKVNGLPNASYNGQLDRIENNLGQVSKNTYNGALGNLQATANSILTNTNNLPRYNAQSDLAAVRANQANQATASALSGVASQVSAIQAGISSGSTVSVGISSATVAYNVNNPALDIFWLLGNSEGGYVNPPSASKINTSSSGTTGGYPLNSIFNRDGAGTGWFSSAVANPYFIIDFLTRTVSLNAVRLSAWNAVPVNILIEGSNNGSSWVSIYAWNSIGYSIAGEYKITTFTASPTYRYIRITQVGNNASGGVEFNPLRLFLYGTITNP